MALSAKLTPRVRPRHDPTLAGSTTTPVAKSSFTLRPGVYGDLPAFAAVYYSSFSDTREGASDDNLLDVLFEGHRDEPDAIREALQWMLTPRLWSLEYRMSALVDDADGKVVGFLCVKRPGSEVSFYERWISPGTWLNTLRTTLFVIRSLVSPRNIFDTLRARAFAMALAELYPKILCTPRRKKAWYLSIVALDPAYQGLGLGGAMVRCALEHVAAVGARQTDDLDAVVVAAAEEGDAEKAEGVVAAEEDEEKRTGEGEEEARGLVGPAMWLTARKGTEGLYRKFGFVKVMDSNQGALAEWNGGAVMFQGLRGAKEIE